MPIRILIADDHAVVRSGLRALLRADPDLEVVGEAEDGVETLRLAGTLQPDLVLLDITMPPENGIKIGEAAEGGAPGDRRAVPHHARGREPAARGAARGRRRLRDQARRGVRDPAGDPCGESRRHLRPSRDDPRAPAPAGHDASTGAASPAIALTRRELDVLRLLAKGNTNRQIAGLLGLSMRTVENHRANLMGKLGLVSRVELVNYAEEHNLL